MRGPASGSRASAPVGAGRHRSEPDLVLHDQRATLAADGKMTLSIDGKSVAEGKAGGPIPSQPRAGLSVGSSGKSAVGEYEAPATYAGKVTNVRIKATAAKK